MLIIPLETSGITRGPRRQRVGTMTPFVEIMAQGVFVPLEAVLGGRSGLGWGRSQWAWSSARRTGWRDSSIACGTAERAGRAAFSWSTSMGRKAGSASDKIAALGSSLVTTQAAKLAASARLEYELSVNPEGRPSEGRELSLLRIAGQTCLEQSSDVVLAAVRVLGEQGAGYRGDGTALGRLSGWIQRATARAADLKTSQDDIITVGNVHRLSIEAGWEDAAILARDLKMFDRVRTRRRIRRASLIGLSIKRLCGRRLKQLTTKPRSVESRIDDLAASFALTNETYARSADRMTATERGATNFHLAAVFGSVTRAIAILEADDAKGNQTTEKDLTTLALTNTLLQGARSLGEAIGAMGSRRMSLILAHTLAAPSRVAVERDLTKLAQKALRDVLSSQETQQRLTSSVFVPSGNDPGIGALERAARLAFVSQRPAAKIEAAVQDLQIRTLPSDQSDPEVKIAGTTVKNSHLEQAVRLSLITDLDRQNMLAADAAARGLVRGKNGPQGGHGRSSA